MTPGRSWVDKAHLSKISKTRAEVFYQVENQKAQPSGFRPYKTRATSFVNGLKNIPEKAFVSRVHKIMLFRTLEISIQKITSYQVSVLEIEISHVS